MKNKRVECLYRLLERAVREKDLDAVAPLKWAYFVQENTSSKLPDN